MIHNCPRCELRFATEAELADHLTVDHHAEPERFERFRYRQPAVRPPGERYLVIANRTLENDVLFERLRELGAGGAHFHIVAPATPVDPASDRVDDKSLALATFRLRHMVDRLHGAGIEAEGEVGVPDPVRAAARALDEEPANGIILSTLPRGTSRWLDVDVPAALERRFSLPVTIVTQQG